jgi:hypothetical protein
VAEVERPAPERTSTATGMVMVSMRRKDFKAVPYLCGLDDHGFEVDIQLNRLLVTATNG